jgi:hypothetical protein
LNPPPELVEISEKEKKLKLTFWFIRNVVKVDAGLNMGPMKITFNKSPHISSLPATVWMFCRSKQHNCICKHSLSEIEISKEGSEKLNQQFTIASIIVTPPISNIAQIPRPDEPACSCRWKFR